MALDVTSPRGFYWLIPPTPARGGLAGMARPSAQAVASLPNLGIGLLVSLLSYTTLDGDTPQALRAIHLPVGNDDVPAPAQYPRIAVACAMMHHWRLRQTPGNSVGVHCLLGQGRTGMLLCCYRGFLLARHPEDPDALELEETALQISGLLREMYDERGLGPRDGQVRAARWFTFWLTKNSHVDFDAQAEEELCWQQEPGSPVTETVSQMLWQCSNPECHSRASHAHGLDTPLWCLSCGQATGRDVNMKTL